MDKPNDYVMIVGSQSRIVELGSDFSYKHGKFYAAKLDEGGYVLLWRVNRGQTMRIVPSRNQDARLALIKSTCLPKIRTNDAEGWVSLEGADDQGGFLAIIYVGREKKGEDSFRRKGGS